MKRFPDKIILPANLIESARTVSEFKKGGKVVKTAISNEGVNLAEWITRQIGQGFIELLAGLSIGDSVNTTTTASFSVPQTYLVHVNTHTAGDVTATPIALANFTQNQLVFITRSTVANDLIIDLAGAETVQGAATLNVGAARGVLLMADVANGNWIQLV
jgi:hypothetical protein